MSPGSLVHAGKWALWRVGGIADRYLQLSRLSDQSRNAVLMYHAVGAEGYDRVSTERFERDIRHVTQEYQVVDLPEVLTDPVEGEKKVAITFDDALENVYRNAIPILREYDVPATIFVVADYVPDGTVTTGNEYMDLEQLRELVEDASFALGNHTKSHPHLSRLATEDALTEQIVVAQRTLERRLQCTVDRFCYPYGDFDSGVSDVVAQSHEYATTTQGRLLRTDDSPVEIPRIDAKEPESLVRWQLSDLSERVKEVALQSGVIESAEF